MPEPWEDQPDDKPSPADELLRQIRGNFKRFKGGFESPARTALRVAAVIVLVAAVFSTFYTVQPQEQAVVLRFGRYVSTHGPGLNLKLPFGVDQVIKVRTEVVHQEEFGFRRGEGELPSEEEAFEKESLTLTGDLNVAVVKWIVQYKVADPRHFLFNTREVIKNLRDVSQSVLRRVVGDRTVSEVLTTGRVEIADEAQRLTQEVLDRYGTGVRIVAVKLQDVNPPVPVRPAFNEVNAAKQDQEKMINQAESEYNRVIPEARGKAEQQIRDAEGYATAAVKRAEGDADRFRRMLAAYRAAPAVTRTRLYMETVEELYSRFKEVTIVDKGVAGVVPVFPQRPQEGPAR